MPGKGRKNCHLPLLLSAPHPYIIILKKFKTPQIRTLNASYIDELAVSLHRNSVSGPLWTHPKRCKRMADALRGALRQIVLEFILFVTL